MATVTYIPEKTQSKTAMGKVMRYCARADKIACEVDSRKFQLISGKNCCGETAYREFMATKQQYKKANGMFFYQYVQSFSPDENITPQMAHEIGCKFAEYFKGHEVLIATHTDAAHIHTHFIINSVNFENGKKLQMPRGSIYKLRNFSDELCRQYDLSIVPPKKTKSKNLNTREYRAALKGESWKWKLINVVDTAMKHSQSKAEFIASMKKLSYGIKWQDNLKHITYTTPDGKKCRDNKMLEQIKQLPSWQEIQDKLNPTLQQMDIHHNQAIQHIEHTLMQEYQNQTSSFKTMVRGTIENNLKGLVEKVTAKDTSDLQFRLKWMGWRALAVLIFFVLLKILKIW